MSIRTKRKGKVGRIILLIVVGIIVAVLAAGLIFGGVIFAGKLVKSFAPTEYKLDIKEKGLLLGGKGESLKLSYEITPTKDAIENEITPTFTSLNEKVATIDETGLVVATGLGETTVSAVLDENEYEIKVAVYDKWVALTYDDGPGPYTEELLGYLKDAGGKATFFLIGQNIKGNESIVKDEFDAGNEIANHTSSHDYSIATNFAKYSEEVKKTDTLIKNIIKANISILLRPPGGFVNDSVTRKQNKPLIMWSIDTLDWKSKNADSVYNAVIKDIFSGAIVLMHDIHPTTVTASKKIINYLKTNGYYFATVSQMLLYPDNGKTYNQGAEQVPNLRFYNTPDN